MSKPLRLLQVASTSQIGGAENLMLDLVRYCNPRRLQPEIVALMANGPLARMADEAGGRGTNWRVRNIADPRLPLRMKAFLRNGAFDVVQTYGLRAELVTRWAARSLGVKLVSSVVSIDPWRRSHHRWLDKATRGGVTVWMSSSQAATRAKIQNEGIPADRIFTIPTGIASRPMAGGVERAAARRRFGIMPGDGPVLACVANIRPAKGYPDLLQALALLVPRWHRLVCLVAGRDDSGGAIPAQARELGLTRHMRWLGFVPDAPAVYDAADIAVLASHWEGMPHALIEALRAGRPTVATDVGGNGEVVRHEHEGLLCPPRDPKGLSEALGRALANVDERKVWGVSARQRFEDEFGVDKMVERMTLLYEGLMGRTPLPPHP